MSEVAYRLGAHALAAAEVVLVQTLCRLYRHGREPFPWVFATTAPYDAVLVDATDAQALQWARSRNIRAVLRLTGMQAPRAPDALVRPIRAEHLREALRALERSWSVPAPPAMARNGGPAPAPASGMAEGQAAGPGAVRLKLRRWPPEALLRRDAGRVRMATALSRRAFSVAELAAISGQPESDCRLFMRLLQSAGLADAEHPAAPTPPRPTEAASTFSGGRLRGLITGIRRHLGIGARQTRGVM